MMCYYLNVHFQAKGLNGYKGKSWYLTLQFIAIRNCTVQLALLLYVASAIGPQHLEEFWTHREMSICFSAHFPRYSVYGAVLAVNWKPVWKRQFDWWPQLYSLHVKWIFWNLVLHWRGLCSGGGGGGGRGQNATEVFSLCSEFFHVQVTVDTWNVVRFFRSRTGAYDCLCLKSCCFVYCVNNVAAPRSRV